MLLREERFAKSGTLLKTTEVREVREVDGRWIANHVVFRDILKEGEGTEFLLEDIAFDVDIPPAPVFESRPFASNQGMSAWDPHS